MYIVWSSPEQRSSGKLGFVNLVPLNCTREMAEVAATGQSVSAQSLSSRGRDRSSSMVDVLYK